MRPVLDSIAREIFLLPAGYDAFEYISLLSAIDRLAR